MDVRYEGEEVFKQTNGNENDKETVVLNKILIEPE